MLKRCKYLVPLLTFGAPHYCPVLPLWYAVMNYLVFIDLVCS